MTPSAADGLHRAEAPRRTEGLYRSGRIPALIATASILQISESMLPHPLPGLRFGLANIVSLIILVEYGFRPALIVTLLRTVVSSFVLGTFLSPGFILSFAGGCASIAAIGLLHHLSQRVPFLRISPIGLGIAGAFVHNMVQLCLAYLMLISHPGIFFLVPWLSFGSVALGAFSGALAASVLNQLALDAGAVSLEFQPVAAIQNRVYRPRNSWLHRCPPEIKIAVVLAVTLTTVLVENLVLYGIIFTGILVLIPAASLAYGKVFQVLKKLWVIILSAFILPLYFNPGSQILIDTALGAIHREALVGAFVFSTRIIILALLSALVAQTTDTKAITRGIRSFIKPFDILGLDSAAIAETIALSLAALPEVWIEIRSVLNALLAGQPRDFKTLKRVTIQLFIYLFATKNGRP